MKFSTNNIVKKHESFDTYIVIATKENNPKQFPLIEGFDYLIQKYADDSGLLRDQPLESVFEDDLTR